jgi:hypothetical protein
VRPIAHLVEQQHRLIMLLQPLIALDHLFMSAVKLYRTLLALGDIQECTAQDHRLPLILADTLAMFIAGLDTLHLV